MQKQLFLIADNTVEVQGLLKRWFHLFCFVFILSGQQFLVLHLPLLLQYFPIKSFSHSEYCLFCSLSSLEVMSRPIGKDIYWRQSTPLGQTGFWLVVQEFMRFFFWYSRWTSGSTGPPGSLHPFSFLSF